MARRGETSSDPRWSAYAAPAVLTLVALAQLYLTHADGRLTPAKGGGFGLFSTVDRMENRILRAEVIGADWRASLNIGRKPEIAPRIDTARGYPTHRHLYAVAEKLSILSFQKPAERFEVSVWRQAFDPAPLAVRRVRIASETFDAAALPKPPPRPASAPASRPAE